MKTTERGSRKRDEEKRNGDESGEGQNRERKWTPDIVIHCSDVNETLVSYLDVDYPCGSPAVSLLSSLSFGANTRSSRQQQRREERGGGDV